MKILTAISLLIFAGFVVAGVLIFKLLPSYSHYAQKWAEKVPLTKMNLWSIVTVIVAGTLFVSMINAGEDSRWQFLGFFAPIYLAVAAFTPKWETDKKQGRIHKYGAIACAVISLLWLILVRSVWWMPVASAAVFALVAFLTKTWKTAYIFWGEMALFSAVYATLLIF